MTPRAPRNPTLTLQKHLPKHGALPSYQHGNAPFSRSKKETIDQSKMKRKRNDPPTPPKVHCCDCRHAERDTEGPSFSIVTGEYFMGRCRKGHDAPFKVFMDKPRDCEDFNRKPKNNQS